MIRDYIRLQSLKRQRKRFEKANQREIDEYEYFEMHQDRSTPPETIMVVYKYANEIRALETKFLRRSAEKWKIELRKEWFDMAYSSKGEQLHLFTDKAVATIKDAIRARKKENRENIEWWVTKVVVPVLGALTGLIGVLLAIYALNK